MKDAVVPRPLPLPEFYDLGNAARWSYAPDQQRVFSAAAAWRRRYRIRPAGEDPCRVQLLLIDLQKDFCFPEGTLYVGGRSGRGAMEDVDRVARFLYRNLEAITDVTCTLDTHAPFQIFSPSFWVDAQGEPLTAHREITTGDIRDGRARPNPAVAWWAAAGDYEWLQRQVEFYCAELERAGKYRLYLWPPHCLLGSDGHALAGVIHEARLFHAYARGARNEVEVKGGNPLTENYSVLAPEVLLRHDGGALAERNTRFVEALLSADAVIVAGEAASHCVKSSLEDLLQEIQARDPGLAGKVYVLQDCMSSVAVPDPDRPGRLAFDFTPQTEAALARFEAAGVHLVRSSDPLESWPGFPLIRIR